MKLGDFIKKLEEYSPDMEILVEIHVLDECILSGERVEYEEPTLDYFLKPKTRPFEADKYDYNKLIIKW